MSADVKKLLGVLEAAMSGKSIEIPKQMGVRDATDLLTTRYFGKFEEEYPDAAKFLREFVQKKTLLSNAILYAAGLAINQVPGIGDSTVAQSAIADFILSFKRNLRDPSRAMGTSEYSALGQKVFQLAADKMTAFVEWQKGFDDNMRGLVYWGLRDKSPDEISVFMDLPEENRMEILLFMKSYDEFGKPRPKETEEPAEGESTFLTGLRNFKAGLQAKRAEQIGGTDSAPKD